MTPLHLTRHPDWRLRLERYLLASARRTYAPGSHDCALLVAGAIEAMTGTDPAADWRGRYDSIEAGLALLQEAGHEDHEALAASLLVEVPPAYARVGDIAIVTGDGNLPAFGVVAGATITVLGETGLASLPLTAARRAFRT